MEPTYYPGGVANPTIPITQPPITISHCPNSDPPKVFRRPTQIPRSGYGWKTSTLHRRPNRCQCSHHRRPSKTTTPTRTTAVSAVRAKSTRSSTKRSPASVSTGCPHSMIRYPQPAEPFRHFRHIKQPMLFEIDVEIFFRTTTSTASTGAIGARCIRIAFGWQTPLDNNNNNRHYITTKNAISNLIIVRS